MITKLKAFWATLPHQIQGAIVAFTSAVIGVLAHHYSDPAAWSLPELKHQIITALASGLGALKVFFMIPNQPNQDQSK